MSEAAGEKQNFYFTFGCQYSEKKHPKYPAASPYGWVRIISSSYKSARQKAFDLFGIHFSTMYTEESFDRQWFPEGEIEAIEID
jgi:hypothetical protein